MKPILLDANVVLRFVIGDTPHQAVRVRELFEEAARGEVRLLITEGTLAEASWVLRGRMRIAAPPAAASLLMMLQQPGLETDSPGLFEDALARMAATGHDLVDCLLAARGAAAGLTVASFDKHLRQHPDIRVWPED